MGTGEVRILRGDDGDLVPEVLLGVMIDKAFADVVALPDVGDAVTPGVAAEQELDSGATGLDALSDLAEFEPLAPEHVPCPVPDLGGHQTAGLAIDEEQSHLLAIHCVAPFSDSSSAAYRGASDSIWLMTFTIASFC